MIANLLTSDNELHDTDSIARWRGEEFIIVVPMLSKKEANMLAEKLRAKTVFVTLKGL